LSRDAGSRSVKYVDCHRAYGEYHFFIESRCPPLIFMDIRLPDLNGLEVTREIKTIDPGTAVVIVTNHDTAEYRDTAEEYGADDFISKTSSIAEEIQRTVHSIPCIRDELGQNSRG
jgi:DNA-binding NarL/FixJ family response regulator